MKLAKSCMNVATAIEAVVLLSRSSPLASVASTSVPSRMSFITGYMPDGSSVCKTRFRRRRIRGNWEPIVTTEEFERGLEILERRSRYRLAKRRHDYLLKGMISYIGYDGYEVKLTGSTSNTYRSSGGTSYYCVPHSNINFKCDRIEELIPAELRSIQVDPELLPIMRTYYTHELAEKLGHNRPIERERLITALNAIDQEETRTIRLLAAGKISEAVWDSLWAEWQDRRSKLRATLSQSFSSGNIILIIWSLRSKSSRRLERYIIDLIAAHRKSYCITWSSR